MQSGWFLPGKEVDYATKFEYLAESSEEMVDAELSRGVGTLDDRKVGTPDQPT